LREVLFNRIFASDDDVICRCQVDKPTTSAFQVTADILARFLFLAFSSLSSVIVRGFAGRPFELTDVFFQSVKCDKFNICGRFCHKYFVPITAF